MERASGWYFNGTTFRSGTVGWEDGVIVEVRTGMARDARVRGVILPGLWNAHTHLGDAVVTRELRGGIEELVAPPHGLKHRVLARAKDTAVIAAMQRAMATMLRTGTTGFTDFREGGLRGLNQIYAAQASLPLQGLILGRPRGLSYDSREVAAILHASDGIGVSSYLDWPADELEKVAVHARRAGKHFALHCSERVREDVDRVLDLKPSFLVHMIHATDADLERCAEAGVAVVVCPRSNAFFGLTPDLPRMLRAGVELRLGTDNAMISTPSILREMEFAYRMARMGGGIPAREVLRMALRGRRSLDPEASCAIRVGEPADLVVLDIPVGSSGFAAVLRASENDVRLVVCRGRIWPPAEREFPRGRKRRRRARP